MTDRMLIKGGIVLTQDPALGEMPEADVLIEDGKIASIGHGLSADGARTIDATGDIVIPGFIDTHRHTWETSIRTSAPDFALITYFGADPRQVRTALPARRRLRRQPVGLARVHQRGHHDARRLVAHHQHARACRRRYPRVAGVEHPVGLRLRVRQHLARRLVVRAGLRGQRADLRRPRCSPDPEAVLQLRRRADHDGARHPRAELLQARRRPARLASRQGARTQHHRPRRDGPVRLHQDAGHHASGHGPAVPEHDLRPRVALHPRGVGARARLRRERLVRAADRGPDGPRLGARGDRPGVRHPDRAVVRRRDDRSIRPVHPDALDLRFGARAEAPGSLGGRPRRARGVAGTHHSAPGPVAGRPSAGPRSPGSPTGRGR